jgi:hypothetical protein
MHYTNKFNFSFTCLCPTLSFAHGRWFSPGTPASSTTKTSRHDIVEMWINCMDCVFTPSLKWPSSAHVRKHMPKKIPAPHKWNGWCLTTPTYIIAMHFTNNFNFSFTCLCPTLSFNATVGKTSYYYRLLGASGSRRYSVILNAVIP